MMLSISLRPNRLPLAALLLSLVLAAGCTEDPVSPAEPVSVYATALPQLDGALYYELWLSYPTGKLTAGGNPTPSLTDAEYISVGRFRVTADGTLLDLSGNPASFVIPEGRNPNLFIDAILTVQQPGVNEGTPGPCMLSGAIMEDAGSSFIKLELKGDNAFGGTIVDDSKRYGSFVLDVPTTPDRADYANGIWFIDAPRDSNDLTIRKGIGLPSLPLVESNERWTYETWLLHYTPSGTEYISLGRFMNPARPDSTGAGPGAGPDLTDVYQEPGEDFVAGTPRTLNDGSYGVILSLQPTIAPIGHPFIELLRCDTIPITAARLDSIPMTRLPGAPTLEVTIAR